MWLLLLLFCWPALSFPSVPQQYSVTVAINRVDLGYTTTYNEFYDGLSTPNGTLYTEGRFGDVSTNQIVDYNARTVTEWTPQSCFVSSFDQLSSAWILGPSIQFFASDSNNMTTTPVLVGTVRSQTETRGILCDKWTSSLVGVVTNNSFINATVSYYFASADSFFGQTDVGTVPVRVWIVGNATSLIDNSTQSIERVYDWVSFNHGVPPGFIFKAPGVCGVNPGNSLIFQRETPNASAVTTAPANGTNLPAPSIPLNFRMLVERKIREDDVMTDITTINWWRDRQHRTERVDLFKNNLAESLVYIYQSAALYDGTGYVYNNSGTQCLNLAVYDRAQCSSSTCSTSRLTKQNINPLLTRDGGFARLFDNGTWLQNAQFQGRSLARGVTADVWSKDFSFMSPTLANVIIVYTQSVYFFPQGWQFPGRDLPPNTTTFPLRIINEGSMRCLGSAPCNLSRTIQFSDMYDIYEFVPGVPAPESLQAPCATCFDGIQNQGEAGIDCGSPCAQPCLQSPETLPFPKISKSYLVSVSANIIDKGYTMSYNEYYDATYNNGAGALLTEGFFADLRQLQLIDYKSRLAYRWTPGAACYYTPLDSVAGYNATYGIGPSSRFFTLGTKDVDKLLYWGHVKSTSETRGILCNKWETLTSASDDTYIYNMSLIYYFAVTNSSQNVRNVGNASVPIRVTLNSTRQSVANPSADPVTASHVYDWTDWQNVKPPAFLFAPPACTLTTNLSRFDASFQNLSTAVVPEPPPNSISFRPFPQTFRMVVEAKLNEGNRTTTVWSANWFLDVSRERVDFQPQGSASSSTLYYEYKSKTALWDGPGVVDTLTGSSCYKLAFNNLASCQSESCKPNVNLTANNSSPILSVRDGGFARLFGPDKTFFLGSVYTGRKLARGLNADVFMKQQNRTTRNGDKYTYFQSVYYFPDGWQFPGRPPYATSVPLRVINDGQFVMKNGTVTTFYDVFDIFQLRPGSPPANIFASRCPDPVAPEDTSNDVGKVIGGIVIAAVIACILGGIFYWIRKRRLPPAEAPKDMQL